MLYVIKVRNLNAMGEERTTDEPRHEPRQWGHKLFGCMEDPCLCLATAWLPCYTFALNSMMLGQGCLVCGWAFTVPVLGCVVHLRSRKEIKKRRHIGGGGDLINVLCCPFCSLCQEAQELRDMFREEAEREALRKQQQNVQVVIVQQPGQQPLPAAGQVYVVQAGSAQAQNAPAVVVVQQPPYVTPTTGQQGHNPSVIPMPQPSDSVAMNQQPLPYPIDSKPA